MPTFGTDTCGTYGFAGVSDTGGAFFLCAKLALHNKSATTVMEMKIRTRAHLSQCGVTSFGEIIFGNIICGKTDPAPTESYNYDAKRLGGV